MPPQTPPSFAGSRTAQALRLSVVASLGLTLVLLGLGMSVSTYDQFELPKLVLLRCATALMLVLWALRCALEGRWVWKRTSLDLPVMAWSLYLVFKTFASVSPSISWRGEYENFNGSLTQLNYSLLYFIAVQNLKTLAEAQSLMLAFLGTALLVSLYGIYQALGMDFILWNASSVIPDRYFATLGNPNFLGALTIMAMPVAGMLFFSKRMFTTRRSLLLLAAFESFGLLAWLVLYLIYAGKSVDLEALATKPGLSLRLVALAFVAGLLGQFFLAFKDRLKPARFLGLGGILLVLFKALLDTGCRGAFYGLLAGCAVFIVLLLGELRLEGRLKAAGGAVPLPNPLLSRKRRLAAILAAILGLVTLLSFALGPELSSRMLETFKNPFHALEISRGQIWKAGLRIWQAYPLTGTGVDTFKTMFPSFSSSKFSEYDGANVSSRTAHCEPLQILSTLGAMGLGLWLWLLATWARAWVKRAPKFTDPQDRLALAAVAAIWTGYLVQNLVSFGVAAITAPFWIFMACPWLQAPGAPDPRLKSRAMPAWARLLLPAAILLLAGWGVFSSAKTYLADTHYNKGSAFARQAQQVTPASLDLSRGCVNAAYLELVTDGPLSDDLARGESIRLLDEARSLETALSEAGGKAPQDLPVRYARVAQALLYLVAARHQTQAVELCPGEVKYRVYQGLAFEELFKRAPNAEASRAWFDRAAQAYEESVRLNPRNAYYSGNLGRLHGTLVELGFAQALPEAERWYRQAIALAPVTALFYQNLMDLYLKIGQPEKNLELAAGLLKRDPRQAGYLYFSAGSKSLMAANEAQKSGDAKGMKAHLGLALEALKKAHELRPDLADAAFNLAMADYLAGDRAAARQAVKDCLKADPGHQMALEFIKEQKW